MEVVLEGANEVPPVTTDAFGSANVTVAGTATTIDGAFEGFEATAAHVHGPADMGETADPVFTLAVDNPDTHFEGTFTMTAEQVGWFEDGLLYLNVRPTLDRLVVRGPQVAIVPLGDQPCFDLHRDVDGLDQDAVGRSAVAQLVIDEAEVVARQGPPPVVSRSTAIYCATNDSPVARTRSRWAITPSSSSAPGRIA